MVRLGNYALSPNICGIVSVVTQRSSLGVAQNSSQSKDKMLHNHFMQ